MLNSLNGFPNMPLLRQLENKKDVEGLGVSAFSRRTEHLEARTTGADRAVRSVPYCAVGCGQLVYVKTRKSSTSKAIRARPSRTDACVPRARQRSSWSRDPPRAACPLPQAARQRVGTHPARTGHGHGCRAREEDARRQLGGAERGRPAGCGAHGDRASGRRDARQRRELSHQEAVHRARHVQIENQARI